MKNYLRQFKNVKTSLTLIIVSIAVSIACSRDKAKEHIEIPKNSLQEEDTAIISRQIIDLAQAILNAPSVVKMSKAEFIREKYGQIYVLFDNHSERVNDSLLYQNGSAVRVTKHRMPPGKPCYVFDKIDIQENRAYISLRFEITGFICYGTLVNIDGKWSPDKDFRVGYE